MADHLPVRHHSGTAWQWEGTRRERSYQAPPPMQGVFIAVDTVWATPRFPLLVLAHLPKLSLGTGFGHRSRDGTKWLDLVEQTW